MIFFIDSFMAYRHNADSKENTSLMLSLLEKIKTIVQSQNVEWQKYLKSTLLYPATITKILQIVS